MDVGRGFVGRDGLVGRVLQLLSDDQCVLFVGPRGIGRTTALWRCADAASRAGFAVTDSIDDLADLGVIVVDDLHLLDGDEQRALRAALDVAEARLLATVTDDASSLESTSAVWREERTQRIHLEPFDTRAVATLTNSMVGATPDSEAVQRIMSWSAGRPRDIVDLVAAATERRWFDIDAGIATLRDGFPGTPALDARLDDLLDRAPEAVRRAVEHVAVGRCVTDEALEALSLADAARAAEERGALRSELVDDTVVWRCASSLIAELARERLDADTHADLRATLVEHLDPAGDEHALLDAEIHISHPRCGPSCGPSVDRGIDVAHRRLDLPLLTALARISHARDGNWSAGARLCDVLEVTGDHDEEARVASELLERAEEDTQRFFAAFYLTSALFSRGEDAEIELAIERARDTMTDPVWLEQLDARQITFAACSGRFDEVDTIGVPLLTSPLAAAHAAIWVALSLTVRGRFQEALDAVEAGEASVGLDLHPVFGQLLTVVRAGAHIHAGDLEAAEATCLPKYGEAIERGDRYPQAWLAFTLGQSALLRGALGSARQWFADAAAAFGVMHERRYVRWALAGLATAAARGGDHDLAARTRSGSEEGADLAITMLDPEVTRYLAWVDIASDHQQRGRAKLRSAADTARSTGQWSIELSALHDLARLGDASSAAEALSAQARAGDGRLSPARVRHIDALAHGDVADVRRAAGEFEEIGAWILAAEAWASAVDLDSDPLGRADATRRALAAQARTEGADLPSLRNLQVPDVGPRARAVADLAAAGVRRRDIASALHLGLTTVNSHLHATFRSLGIADRSELASALEDFDRIHGAVTHTKAAVETGTRDVFVGRADELAHLRRMLSRDDRSGAVLIGEAGIGKSRLIAELAGELRSQGRSVVGPDELWRLGTSVGENSDRRPVILLDDLDRTASDELAVVQQAVNDSGAFVLATARTVDEVDALSRDLAVLTMRPLSDEAVGRIVRSVLGGLVLGSTITEVARLSGGNPLFARELLRSALAHETLTEESGAWILRGSLDPERHLGSLIEARLDALDRASRVAFDGLAATGALGLQLAEIAMGEQALGHLRRLDLVTVDAATVRIAHPLYEEARREALGAAARRDWFATLLEAAQHRPTAATTAELTRWRIEAGEPPGVLELIGATSDALASGDGRPAERLATEALQRCDDETTRDRLVGVFAEHGTSLETVVDDPTANGTGCAILDLDSVAPGTSAARAWRLTVAGDLVAAAAALDEGAPTRNSRSHDLEVLTRWTILVETGTVDAADRLIAEGVGGGTRGTFGRGIALGNRMIRAGRPRDAIVAFGDVLAGQRLPPGPVWQALAQAGIVRAHALAGTHDHARDAFDRLVELGAGDQFAARRASAWLSAAEGRPMEGIATLHRLGRESMASGAVLPALDAWYDAVLLGDTAVAVADLAACDPEPMAAGPAARILHAQALLEGEVRLASVAERLVTFGYELGAFAAVIAVSGNGAGVPAALDDLVDRVVEPEVAEFVERGWVVRALTPRQCEIAELAAAGRPSREIAEMLGLSVRTVENHLQRTYDRLGVTGRSEIAELFGVPTPALLA